MLPTLEKVVQALRQRQLRERLWRVAQRLTPLILQRDDERIRSADDLLAPGRAPIRFLGYYTEAGLDAALREYGIARELKERGFGDFRLSLRRDDRYTSTLRCYGIAAADGREHLLAETRCRLQDLPRPRWLPPELSSRLNGCERCVRIEWMLLQNPLGRFEESRPPLPGQRFPGLGMGRQILEVLRILAWRLNVDAYVVHPFFVHNAVIYSRQFTFLEPRHQARLLAIVAAAGERPLQQIALAVEHGFLRSADDGRVVRWEATPQVSPLSRTLKALYESSAYAEAVKEAFAEEHLQFDWEAYDRAHEQLAGQLPLPDDPSPPVL